MINLGILQQRRHFVDLQLKLLNKLQDKYKKLINIFILTKNEYQSKYSEVAKQELNGFLSCESIGFQPHHNFMEKVWFLIDKPEQYSLRMDEDVFIMPHVIEAMIDKIHLLDNDSNMLLAPCFATGVPSCDWFLEDYMKEEQKQEMFQYFLETNITKVGNHVCPDAIKDPSLSKFYLKLNDHTVKAKKWNVDLFMNDVRKIEHVYKGIHPVRINYNAQKYILDFAVCNLDKFKEKRLVNIEYCKYEHKPYYCNHVHLIKNKVWKEAIEKYSHGFDEVSINLYRQYNDKYFCFLRNTFAIHVMYANALESPNELNPHSYYLAGQVEQNFYLKFKELLGDL